MRLCLRRSGIQDVRELLRHGQTGFPAHFAETSKSLEPQHFDDDQGLLSLDLSVWCRPRWCVFELAAYRKMNPSGKIVIAPISNELLACKGFLWVNLFTFVFWFSRRGTEGGDGVRLLAVFLCVFSVMFPSLAHVAWKQKLDRDKLDSDLATFDVMNVECSNDFDRQCIHEAIIQWYGSLAAFSAHVQGPFHREVVRLMRAGGSVPFAYVWLSLRPIF